MKKLVLALAFVAVLAGCAEPAQPTNQTAASAPLNTEPMLQTDAPWEPEPVPDGTAVSPELYERAREISRSYGVQVLIADQCGERFGTFTAEPMLEEQEISEALDTLEQLLAEYPEGFFRQLRWDSVQGVQLQLCGTLHPGQDYDPSSGYAAFVLQTGDTCTMVADVRSAGQATYVHEFSHVIDRKLAWDASRRTDALYSEEAWNALNPEGFSYSGDYAWVPSGFSDPLMFECFVSPYSMVSATEDRAQIMEAAVAVPWAFDGAPVMRQKLDYYSRCIRDCFEDALWPEVTVWEQVLRE